MNFDQHPTNEADQTPPPEVVMQDVIVDGRSWCKKDKDALLAKVEEGGNETVKVIENYAQYHGIAGHLDVLKAAAKKTPIMLFAVLNWDIEGGKQGFVNLLDKNELVALLSSAARQQPGTAMAALNRYFDKPWAGAVLEAAVKSDPELANEIAKAGAPHAAKILQAMVRAELIK